MTTSTLVGTGELGARDYAEARFLASARGMDGETPGVATLSYSPA